MNCPNLKPKSTTRILFVWDGKPESIKLAERFANRFDYAYVHSVFITPHESFCAYTTVGYAPEGPSPQERCLNTEFENSLDKSGAMRNSKLEIVFGDRVHDVCRLVEVMKVEYVLMPSFTQSGFSKWLFGNLNDRIRQLAGCNVIFQESISNLNSREAEPLQSQHNVLEP